ncbi:uncharacterized protein LACBIDRAFT_297945 [Laccaria bicolor S238N-H82]|uniref:Predicted protein n=1 Tax=Laccaria bicolor (strain S238N-H82 / ATCC MYA-4686) TaxID=486041 RepID=B0DBW3_LACBS|nr:uncharacterized protein LACBIDRAFT_297945 [Laccaria bicolor S238N-H82]EDR07787.1 predicted protein [Laccaria bicolor S238N-H82]|eukprot:XP_001881576.1 predicted protein [Laccaria bicolor S238N-H82]
MLLVPDDLYSSRLFLVFTSVSRHRVSAGSAGLPRYGIGLVGIGTFTNYYNIPSMFGSSQIVES